MMFTDEEVFDLWREKYDAERVDLAVRIYDEVLVVESGAYEAKGREDNTMRQQFVQWFATGSPGSEFRFMGTFGFGGKFWDTGRKWHVNYYSENRTPDRDLAEVLTNQHLAALAEEVGYGEAR